MAEQVDTALDSEQPNEGTPTSSEELGSLELFKSFRIRYESLFGEIERLAETARSRNDEIEQTQVEIGGKQSALAVSIEALESQVEAAKKMASDLNGLQTSTQTTANQITETNAQASAVLEATRTALSNANDAASKAESMKVQIEQTAGIAATKSNHIEDGRVHADEVRAKLDTLLTQAQQSATNTEAQHQASRGAIENINALQTSAQSAKSNIDSNADAVATLKQQCDEHMTKAKSLADIAEVTEAKVKQYEARLAELEGGAAESLRTIESLLPGATSAGLASAFNLRSGTFKLPVWIWQSVFLASLIALLGLAAWEAWSFGNPEKAPDWSELIRMMLHRVPFFIPLVWLAIHAARQASLSKRLEEEYAFKATISTSFEGYRKQMAEIGKDLPPNSPLGQLCAETLRIIGASPGRIYDKHRMDPTPGTAVAETLRPLADALSRLPSEVPSKPK